MGQVTEAFARQMRKHGQRGEHSPLTVHEEQQLAYSWLCLHTLRRLAVDGDAAVVMTYLTDPVAMAQAIEAVFSEDSTS